MVDLPNMREMRINLMLFRQADDLTFVTLLHVTPETGPLTPADGEATNALMSSATQALLQSVGGPRGVAHALVGTVLDEKGQTPISVQTWPLFAVATDKLRRSDVVSVEGQWCIASCAGSLPAALKAALDALESLSQGATRVDS